MVLSYGADAGLAHERARLIVAASVDDPADPFQAVRMDGDAIADDPGRLVDEATTVPLFGGRRALWVRAGARLPLASVEAVLSAPLAECRIVIEGGDWKKGNPLVSLLDRARNAAVLASYADDGRSLAVLVRDEVAGAGLTIDKEAGERLAALLGADRLASRAEVAKLCLYAHGQGRITLDDVEAVVGDAAGLATDAIVDAAFSGRPRDLDTLLARAGAEALDASVLAGAALRHALLLHALRPAVERGRSAASVVEGARGIFFKRRDAIAAQLAGLSSERLDRIVADLQDTILETRRKPSLDDAILGRALMRIALAAAPRRAGAR